MKMLNKVPRENRPWDILKAPGDAEIADRVGRIPSRQGKAGQTEMIWDRRDFEARIVQWLQLNPIPAFLLAK